MSALRAGRRAPMLALGRAPALDQSSVVARTPLNSSGKSLPSSKLQAKATPAPTMTTRARARASLASSTPLMLAQLPDEVLLHTLGFLDFQERCVGWSGCCVVMRSMPCVTREVRLGLDGPPSPPPPLTAPPPLCRRQRVALVSNRFAALCGSPALLQEAKIRLRSFADADSAAACLKRHARHVEKLEVEVYVVAANDVQVARFASAIATCLAVAGLPSWLDELSVFVCFPLHTEWLHAVSSLRRLSLNAGEPTLFIAPAISALTALQSLELCGPMLLLAGCRLPSSITRLYVHGDLPQALPPQASRAGRVLPDAS